jgi:hypothetical protein
MSDLDLVREFRADAPTTTPTGARDLLLRDLQPGRRGTARWLVAAAALVVGAGVVVAVQSGPGAAPSAAATVLDRAADVVAADDVPRPDAHQWFFRSGKGLTPSGEVDLVGGQGWYRFDGKKYAEAASDRPDDVHVGTVSPEALAMNFNPDEAWDAAAALPADPDALLSALRDSELADPEGTTEAARDYDAVLEVLRHQPLPSQTQANLYRALATIPGVGVDEDPEPDLLGRPVVSVTFDGDVDEGPIRSRTELLLDPDTFAYLGQRATALEAGTSVHGYAVEAGEVWIDSAIVGPIAVDRPGLRR